MNISISEIIVVLLIALLVIKPEQLPEIAHALGRFTQSLRKLFTKVKTEFDGLVDSVDSKEHKRE